MFLDSAKNSVGEEKNCHLLQKVRPIRGLVIVTIPAAILAELDGRNEGSANSTDGTAAVARIYGAKEQLGYGKFCSGQAVREYEDQSTTKQDADLHGR